MFQSAVLDVALGLTFIYTLLSLVISALKEGMSRYLGKRSRILQEGIHSIFLRATGSPPAWGPAAARIQKAKKAQDTVITSI